MAEVIILRRVVIVPVGKRLNRNLESGGEREEESERREGKNQKKREEKSSSSPVKTSV